MKKRYCLDCDKEITDLHYNCKRCPSCAEEHKAETDRDFMNEKRKLGEDKRPGTGYLGPHMRTKKNGKPDFDAELKAIQNEMKKLGLKKK